MTDSAIPAVSICLPVYNGEQFISQAIESALAQTFCDFELLIADDCSSDGSEEIAKSYAQQDQRIVYWKNQHNKGLFANYNECMVNAKGSYIKLFAQDDVLEPTILDEMLSSFESVKNLALVSVGRKQIDGNGKEIVQLHDLDSSGVSPGKRIIQNCLTLPKNIIGEPSATMFPRALVGAGFDASYYHLGDLELWLRLLKQGDFLYIDKPLCNFRRHATAATNKNISGLLYALDLIRLGDSHAAELSEIGLTMDQFKMLMIRCIASFMDQSIDAGDMSLDTLLAQTPNSEAEARQQLALFKLLSFLALKYAHTSVESLENELDKVNGRLAQVNLASRPTSRSGMLFAKAANLLIPRQQ